MLCITVCFVHFDRKTELNSSNIFLRHTVLRFRFATSVGFLLVLVFLHQEVLVMRFVVIVLGNITIGSMVSLLLWKI